jgi:broad specificity phosphatase PhoE
MPTERARRRCSCSRISAVGNLYLIRHGETEWSRSGQHTSYTDIDLTPTGETQARLLGGLLGEHAFAAVLTSPRLRARRTAELAGLRPAEVAEDLTEWHYGEYEGRTTVQIREQRPDWSLWTDGCPGGESPDAIGARIDALLSRVRPMAESGDVALVAHGHCLRVVGARWVGLPVASAGVLYLDTASVSQLGYDHGAPVLRNWNVTI